MNPGLQVPRNPMAFHSPTCSSSSPGGRHSTSTWSFSGLSADRRAVASTASANWPYEMTGACFSRWKVLPATSTAQTLLPTSPPVPTSVVAEASRYCRSTSSTR